MPKEIEKTVTDNIDVFFGKINEAADIVTAKLVEVAPEAADALLTLVQFKGIFSLVCAFVLMGVAALAVSKVFLPGCRLLKEDEYSGLGLAMAGGGGFAGLFASLYAMMEMFNFYYWLSAFYPEGAIALKALQAVGVDL